MIEANKLRKGTTFEDNGELFKVLDYTHIKMARGGATVRTKVINLRSGSITEKTFNTGEKVQDVRLDHQEVQFLYSDGDLYYFMNTETYEQPALGKDVLADVIPYLIDGLQVKLSTYEGEPIDLELPTTIELEVVETEPGFAGDTATGATKLAKLSTGLDVQVPLFINEGDTIRVDTRSSEYLTRV